MTSPISPASRRRACLVGGAIGDALGAPVEFQRLDEIQARFGSAGVTDLVAGDWPAGTITDDTQMTMFTAEGLIRANVRWLSRGICHPPSVVGNAYQRWLLTQGEVADAQPDDGWLVRNRVLHARRAPGVTCLSALRPGDRSMRADNDSKGCGGVMRVAPVGLIAKDPFALGCEVARLTHGHPTGYLAAGALALIIARLYSGATLDDALDAVARVLEGAPDAAEVAVALQRARDAASEGPATPGTVEMLGAGWVAEEALAIAVYCALTATDFASGVLAAVNHSGDSDSTGAIAGNILGVMLGEEALPQRWVDRVEGVDLLRELADDLGRVKEFTSDPNGMWEPNGTEVPGKFREKYPGF